MKIAIGADHRGFEMKSELKAWLEKRGYVVADLGTHGPEACDYPPIAERVGDAVAGRRADRGILACKSGIGMSIAANKIPGVRAALVHSVNFARLSREHNDANVLVLSADDMSDPMAEIVRTWLETPFEGGRHQRRVEQISEIEKKRMR